jgi:hypothetical protein
MSRQRWQLDAPPLFDQRISERLQLERRTGEPVNTENRWTHAAYYGVRPRGLTPVQVDSRLQIPRTNCSANRAISALLYLILLIFR